MTERTSISATACVAAVIGRLIKAAVTLVIMCAVGFGGLVLFKAMTESGDEAVAYGRAKAAREEAVMRLAGDGNAGKRWDLGERPKPQTPLEKQMQKIQPWLYIK